MRRALLLDAGLATVLAILVLILAPGVAIVAVIAIAVVVICGASLLFGAVLAGLRRHRRLQAAERRRRSTRVR